jgi:serine/threonine-protein kinase
MGATRLLGDRYRLIGRLGAGGMSEVWRAHDEVLGRHVAVKMLSSRLAGDAASRELIRAEARAAGRLSHPHVTSVYDYGEAVEPDGTRVPFVVMELVDGVTLDARLARGPLPWPVAVRVAAEVAAALAAAHAQELVHRDIKPANVMLTSAGVKVVDFGIAALVGADADRASSVLGTPAYVAPERLMGKAVTAASDVYALGLLLVRMLTGRLPWHADTVTQMIKAHQYAEPLPLPPVAGLPAVVADMCARSLAKVPDDRPSAQEVALTLSAAVGIRIPLPLDDAPMWEPVPSLDVPTEVVDATGPTTAGRWRGHRRWVVAAGATAVVTVTGLAAWAGVGEQPESTAQAMPLRQQSATPPPIACEVRYQTKKDEGGAFDVDLAVVNNSTRPLGTWTLRFDFPADQRLTGGAGAQWAQSGQTVTTRGTGVLATGATATMSMTGEYRASNPIPTAFALNGAPCRATITGATAVPAAVPAAAQVAAQVAAPPAGVSAGIGGGSGVPSPGDSGQGSQGHRGRADGGHGSNDQHGHGDNRRGGNNGGGHGGGHGG